jgi:hypothetical protein
MAIMPSAPTSGAPFKQYEKFSTFLRNELCSNNLTDFGLKNHMIKRLGWTCSNDQAGTAGEYNFNRWF